MRHIILTLFIFIGAGSFTLQNSFAESGEVKTCPTLPEQPIEEINASTLSNIIPKMNHTQCTLQVNASEFDEVLSTNYGAKRKSFSPCSCIGKTPVFDNIQNREREEYDKKILKKHTHEAFLEAYRGKILEVFNSQLNLDIMLQRNSENILEVDAARTYSCSVNLMAKQFKEAIITASTKVCPDKKEVVNKSVKTIFGKFIKNLNLPGASNLEDGFRDMWRGVVSNQAPSFLKAAPGGENLCVGYKGFAAMQDELNPLDGLEGALRARAISLNNANPNKSPHAIDYGSSNLMSRGFPKRGYFTRMHINSENELSDVESFSDAAHMYMAKKVNPKLDSALLNNQMLNYVMNNEDLRKQIFEEDDFGKGGGFDGDLRINSQTISEKIKAIMSKKINYNKMLEAQNKKCKSILTPVKEILYIPKLLCGDVPDASNKMKQMEILPRMEAEIGEEAFRIVNKQIQKPCRKNPTTGQYKYSKRMITKTSAMEKILDPMNRPVSSLERAMVRGDSDYEAYNKIMCKDGGLKGCQQDSTKEICWNPSKQHDYVLKQKEEMWNTVIDSFIKKETALGGEPDGEFLEELKAMLPSVLKESDSANNILAQLMLSPEDLKKWTMISNMGDKLKKKAESEMIVNSTIDAADVANEISKANASRYFSIETSETRGDRPPSLFSDYALNGTEEERKAMETFAENYLPVDPKDVIPGTKLPNLPYERRVSTPPVIAGPTAPPVIIPSPDTKLPDVGNPSRDLTQDLGTISREIPTPVNSVKRPTQSTAITNTEPDIIQSSSSETGNTQQDREQSRQISNANDMAQNQIDAVRNRMNDLDEQEQRAVKQEASELRNQIAGLENDVAYENLNRTIANNRNRTPANQVGSIGSIPNSSRGSNNGAVNSSSNTSQPSNSFGDLESVQTSSGKKGANVSGSAKKSGGVSGGGGGSVSGLASVPTLSNAQFAAAKSSLKGKNIDLENKYPWEAKELYPHENLKKFEGGQEQRGVERFMDIYSLWSLSWYTIDAEKNEKTGDEYFILRKYDMRHAKDKIGSYLEPEFRSDITYKTSNLLIQERMEMITEEKIKFWVLEPDDYVKNPRQVLRADYLPKYFKTSEVKISANEAKAIHQVRGLKNNKKFQKEILSHVKRQTDEAIYRLKEYQKYLNTATSGGRLPASIKEEPIK